MIPSRLLAHTVTVIRPAQTSNGYGDPGLDYGPGATRTDIAARVEQTGGREVTEGRDALISDWRLVSGWLELDGRDRLLYQGTTFEVVGPVATVTDSAGAPHHVTANLRTVEG